MKKLLYVCDAVWPSADSGWRMAEGGGRRSEVGGRRSEDEEEMLKAETLKS